MLYQKFGFKICLIQASRRIPELMLMWLPFFNLNSLLIIYRKKTLKRHFPVSFEELGNLHLLEKQNNLAAKLRIFLNLSKI